MVKKHYSKVSSILLLAAVYAVALGWGYIVFGLDWLVLAPVAMTALFLFISIPMMEHRQLENKPGYADYIKHTRIFI